MKVHLPLLNNYVIPTGNHPGAFGVVRKHHIHEGIDLYADSGEVVYSMFPGIVVSIEPFTGPKAESPWWLDTQAIAVKHDRFVVIYGEIAVNENLFVGDIVDAGTIVGHVIPVLRHDKGKPMSMLHLEQYDKSITKSCGIWSLNTSRPIGLQDPTNMLLSLFGVIASHT